MGKNATSHSNDESTKARPLIDGSVESCIALTKEYIQADGLNTCFLDLSLFNATKLFSP